MPVNEVAFSRLRWVDPIMGQPLEPLINARTPAGGPLCGALQVSGTQYGYPVVDCVARLTPELAQRHREWLQPFGLVPPSADAAAAGFQDVSTVDSFGFQWSWNAEMRSEADLRWRVAERFRIDPEGFRGRLVLDAGAGAGDQSRWLLERGAHVVSIDLSSAIDVVARKLRGDARWVGVQGDITVLPFADSQFDFVYCEGVIQHTRDSALTVRELCRVLRPGGTILATHYAKPSRLLSRIKARYVLVLRKRLQRWDRYKLLWLTGNLAALGYLPVLGRLLRRSGTAVHSERMPDFKTSWTNTFDNYGTHAYQRYVSDDEFWGYFERAGKLEKAYADGTVIAARRVG